jgi:hypothetical protein
MRNKYRAKKCYVGNMVFDSQKEMYRYQELSLLERAGKISNLKRQVKFTLIPAQYESFERISNITGKRLKDGKRVIEKECSYVADFVYEENGETIVEDVKGCKTKDYIIKRKLMLYVHGVRLREV